MLRPAPMAQQLTILAGDGALEALRERSLGAEDITIVPGASGGPKWLVLTGIDRYLFGDLLAHRKQPLEVIGSSIGAWRMACLAQPDPIAAQERFLEAYIEQRYPPRPPPSLVSARSRQILDTLLGGTEGAEAVARHRWLRTHIIAARCRPLPGIADRRIQAATLLGGGLANVASRRALGLLFERVVVSSKPSSLLLARLGTLPTRIVEMRPDNVADALLATASIPMVLEPQRTIRHGPPGPYVDGGLVDYHPSFDFGSCGGIALYPHFFTHLIPGWFDKRLRWRRARTERLGNVVLVAPSRRFVESLPAGRIPDRQDFMELGDSERIRRWRTVVDRARELGDELAELMASNRLAEVARPLQAQPK